MKKFYPRRLLPKENYRIITLWPTDICRFYVARTSEKYVKIHSKAYLRKNLSQHLQASRFFSGLSVNFVSVFKRQDSRIALDYKNHREHASDWCAEHKAMCPEKSHIRHFHSGYYGFQIKDLQKIRREQVELKVGNQKKGRYNISFVLIHRPTVSNYWHCELHIYGKSVDPCHESGTMIELQQKGIVSKNAVTSIANSMMTDFEKIVKSKNEIKRRRIDKKLYIEV